jgi:hypothetical protein
MNLVTMALSPGSILRPGGAPVFNSGGVKRTAYDMVLDSRKVLDTTAPDQNHRVFRQIVALPRDIGGDLLAIEQSHPGTLAQRGVRLFGRLCPNPRTHPAALRRSVNAFGFALQGIP